MIHLDVQKGSIQTTMVTYVQSIVQVMRADAGDDIQMTCVELEVVINGQVSVGLKQGCSSLGSCIVTKHLQPAQRDGECRRCIELVDVLSSAPTWF